MTKILFYLNFAFLIFILSGCEAQTEVEKRELTRLNDSENKLTKLMIVYHPKTNIPDYENYIKEEFEKVLSPYGVEVIYSTQDLMQNVNLIKKERPSHELEIIPYYKLIDGYIDTISCLCYFYESYPNEKQIFKTTVKIHQLAGEDNRAQNEMMTLAEEIYRDLLYEK